MRVVHYSHLVAVNAGEEFFVNCSRRHALSGYWTVGHHNDLRGSIAEKVEQHVAALAPRSLGRDRSCLPGDRVLKFFSG